ncbi:hypothetical protein KEM55_007766 [Ascosphaera atra]|nr:hypothetical protein KEM55_007766 [Ascosphaera atra]
MLGRPFNILKSNYLDAIMPLQTHVYVNSEQGLSSVTTLIEGAKENIIVDPPFLIPDAEGVVKWAKSISSNPVKAVFVTHHHPDHFFSANPILDAFPEAKFYAAPYVLDGIEREYDAKVAFWPALYPGLVPTAPRKPEPFPFSFIILDGNRDSPIALLGPLQGDSVDHCLLWLPVESTIICGDTVYARSTHAWYVTISAPISRYVSD